MSLLLAYYGDDFTGSTDVMEALQWVGLRTVLFLDSPTPEQLARFENLRAFGVAGWSRTMSPPEMEVHLGPVFQSLKASGAPLVHYKICSTFDSSPEIGSIGKAIEIGREIFGDRPIPVVVGAPVLGRYTVFGNLFARSGLDTEPFRLDRHPTMKQHPITPMRESDLRLILAEQTKLPLALFDVVGLESAAADEHLDELLSHGPAAVIFDVLAQRHLPTIGRLIERIGRPGRPSFTVGSSGVEYALREHWNVSGKTPAKEIRPGFGKVEQLLVVTGSCSPVNDRQIEHALQNGFVEIPVNPARLIHPEKGEAELDATVRKGLEMADRGANVILHSSRGPADKRVAETLQQYRDLGFSNTDVKLKNGRTLGPKLGQILKRMLEQKRFQRVAVAGGDTSGYTARELGIEALEAVAPVAPGSPLCRVHGGNGIAGMEIIFKGGQVGRTDIYKSILKGTN